MKNTYALIIDPQTDFCEGGALAVKGGKAALGNLAQFLRTNSKSVSEVRVSMDCHQAIHIAHDIFWHDKDGNAPALFRVISDEEVQNGDWVPFHPELADWAKAYTAGLKNNGRYELRIWPAHCIFGTEGWTVLKPLMNVLYDWEVSQKNRIHWIQKGNNFLTEQYSAIMADVPDPMDPTTDVNRELIDDLNQADAIVAGGLALSHCLGGTLLDYADHGGDISKVTLLTDCTASVEGLEALGQAYVDKLVARGMKLATSDSWKP